MPEPVPDHDRPPHGLQVEVIGVSGTPQATTTVEISVPHELVLAVGTGATGRRVRLGLGARVLVWWTGPDGVTRYRPYEVGDVRGGAFPTWVLRPCGVCSAGDRRATQRVTMEVPVGLVTPLGMVLGETTDISEGGVRAVFAAPPTVGFSDVVQPFPDPGDVVTLAVVLGGTRTELPSRVLQSERLPDGRRLLRASFEEVDVATRTRLRITTSQEIGRQLTGHR
ncbi:PilZ domain-containing protein [Klenkia sp. LSe6-5]|uniref:PilZ domain-containing protein n=1 Tax=Klenkia sesuvii TaxID=3103137 RepID=A0ABU8DNH0_9ACTN